MRCSGSWTVDRLGRVERALSDLPSPTGVEVVVDASGAQSQAKSSTVSEADVGRLGPEQEALVDQARQGQAGARDALSRTTLGLQQARNEENTAKADQQAATADQKVADAQQRVADDSRAPDALEKARQLQERAKAHKQVADLHVDYANKLIDERKAEVQAAEQHVKVAEARVEWSKLQALEQANNPDAGKYDAGRFQTAVNEAQADLDKTAKKAQDLEARATAARQRWEDAQRGLRAPGSSDEIGTGAARRNRLVLALMSADIARTVGIDVARLDLLYLFAFAVTVGLGLRYLGVLLMGSLIIIPAATAKLLARSLTTMLSVAVAVAVVSTLAGEWVAARLHSATGPVIITIAAGLFFVGSIARRR
ncbi:MAG TPA: metal ABC transporter permease [Anaeromyxobacteraceae bacterium]|nr:metal ABC transporter permease [Anaeromyxobacteraceae bacterium]